MAYAARQTPQTVKKETATMFFGDVRGVDFRSDETESYRTPNSVNMYRSKLGTWETHPGFRSVGRLDGDIYGIERFSYIDNYGEAKEQVLVHAGTKMYLWDNYPEEFTALTELYDGMAPKKARYAVFNNILLIADGSTLFFYDGDVFDMVESRAFIPQTWTGKSPNASAGSAYQQRNLLTPYFTEGFTADSETKEYKLSLKDLDNEPVKVWRQENGEDIYLTEGADFSVDRANGIITFTTAPNPEISGVENVFIRAAKSSKGYENKINRCTEILVFDNRVFLTGNPEYPNTVFWSGNGDMTYYGEIMYSDKAGTGSAPIVALQLLSDSKFLSIKKDTNQDGTYAVWSPYALNDDYVAETYITAAGNSNIGCVSTYAQCVFVDDNVFLSNNGLSAISRNLSVSLERNVEHRSTLVDAKLLTEDLAQATAVQHGGRLYILFPNGHCYIADSAVKTTKVSGMTEYEWAYLEDIGVYEGQTLDEEKGAYTGGAFVPPTMINSLGENELFFAAGKTLCRFNFDMGNEDGTYSPKAYHFNGRAINDFVDSPFSWFEASNRFKNVIRKYNDLYCDTRANSRIEVLWRTEKSHMADSKVLPYSSAAFSFAEVNFSNSSFETLPQASFVLRKLKAKKFRRLQLRIRSAEIYCPLIFKRLVIDAYVLTRKLK